MSGQALIGGAGLGVAFMYLFDPVSGKQRRAMLHDRFFHGVRSAGGRLAVVSRSVANRSRGLLAKARSRSAPVTGPVSDTVLAERVRSQIGHVVTHAGAIDVSVRDGHVTLSGHVLCGEIRRLLRRISRVPGVTGVANELAACEPDAWALPDKVASEARPQ